MEKLNLLENKNKPIECYELFWDDAQEKYFPQYKRRARDIWQAYVSAFFAMFTGRGVYGNTKLNYLDWKERIAAIVFNLINFGGLASLVFAFVNLSPFLLVVGGVLVLTGLYSAWCGANISKESRRICVEAEKSPYQQKWQLVSKNQENITIVPVQGDSKLVSDGIEFTNIKDPNFSFNENQEI